MNTVAIIQARLNSTRLPGKVLLPVWDTAALPDENAQIPIFLSVYNRVRAANVADHILFAIPDQPILSQLIDGWHRAYYRDEVIDIYRDRKAESDVLGRYWRTASYNHADVIIRITCDCPLIEPQAIQEAVRLFTSFGGKRLVATSLAVDGSDVEVFSWEMLDRWHHDPTMPWEDREHVTKWAKSQGEGCFFYPHCLGPSLADGLPKLSVDTPEDYDRVFALSTWMAPNRGIVEALQLMEKAVLA